jgi:hypothetical protein
LAPRIACAPTQRSEVVVSLGETLIARNDFLRSEFYNEFARRYGMDYLVSAHLRAPSESGADAKSV